MDPNQVLNRVYLGDRAIKKIIVDGWSKSVSIQVDCISIINNINNFDIRDSHDIKDGYLIFQNVSYLNFESEGYLPNDYIEILSVEQMQDLGDKPRFLFTLSAGFVDADSITHEIVIRITAEKVLVKDHMIDG